MPKVDASLNLKVIILAAGSSSRMGRPKQLLPWGNTTLLEHSLHTVLELESLETLVVLGANFNLIKEHIINYPVTILDNKTWQEGLGNSIAFAVNYICKSSEKVDAVLIVLADQPFIRPSYLKDMMASFQKIKNRFWHLNISIQN
ncbi:nucleotidyltransferase family protein [Formosa haliotis]|uniref:nucleotidyltransferase family protein n=1 Tax=Formosa haliotis TaxID=1555194 RepID=UPI0009F2DB94|nr:nucleotidyltransferase family protein [Formosa haliotis]